MKRSEFTLTTAVDMNRYNFKHLPEVIASYERQLKKAKAEEKKSLMETIAQRKKLLMEYETLFPEGPL